MNELQRFAEYVKRKYGKDVDPSKLSRALYLAKKLDENGGEMPAEGISPESLKEVDFITYPENVEGANCFNCEFMVKEKGDSPYCDLKEIHGQPVTARNCCGKWDGPGTIRHWKDMGYESGEEYVKDLKRQVTKDSSRAHLPSSEDDASTHPDPIDQRLWQQCLLAAKKRAGSIDGFTIKFVDFAPLKVKYAMDLIEGTNPLVRDFVPKNEVWIDSGNAPKNWPYVIYHEIYETRCMKGGDNYDEAHKKANAAERQLRMNGLRKSLPTTGLPARLDVHTSTPPTNVEQGLVSTWQRHGHKIDVITGAGGTKAEIQRNGKIVFRTPAYEHPEQAIQVAGDWLEQNVSQEKNQSEFIDPNESGMYETSVERDRSRIPNRLQNAPLNISNNGNGYSTRVSGALSFPKCPPKGYWGDGIQGTDRGADATDSRTDTEDTLDEEFEEFLRSHNLNVGDLENADMMVEGVEVGPRAKGYNPVHALQKLGDKLRDSSDPSPMPGYGQIFLDEKGSGRVWYVGGDGDDDGFSDFVKEQLSSVKGIDEVIYEAEGFPPKDEGWVQVYPEKMDWTKSLDNRNTIYESRDVVYEPSGERHESDLSLREGTDDYFEDVKDGQNVPSGGTNRTQTIAVDFDGTLAEWRADEDLDKTYPREGAKEALRKFRDAGLKILIWTARPDLVDIEDWLKEHDIPFDSLNDNPYYERGSRKIFADVYIDDRAVPAPEDRDWYEIARETMLSIFGEAKQPIDPSDGYRELEKMADEALPELKELLGKLDFPFIYIEDLPLGGVEAELQKPGGFVVFPPIKSKKRALEKVDSDYEGDWSRILDIVRASVVVDTLDDLYKAVEKVDGEYARFPKDRFKEPLANGYRDYLVNYKLPSGMIVEVQFHLKPIFIARGREILAYDVVRAIKASMEEEGRTEMTPAEAEACRRARKQSERMYAIAWEECEEKEKHKGYRKVKGIPSRLTAPGYKQDPIIQRYDTAELLQPYNRDPGMQTQPRSGEAKTGGTAAAKPFSELDAASFNSPIGVGFRENTTTQAELKATSWVSALPRPKNMLKSSYFEECSRDEQGRCKPSGAGGKKPDTFKFPHGWKDQRAIAAKLSDDQLSTISQEFENRLGPDAKEYLDYLVQSDIEQGSPLKNRPIAVRAFNAMDLWAHEEGEKEDAEQRRREAEFYEPQQGPQAQYAPGIRGASSGSSSSSYIKDKKREAEKIIQAILSEKPLSEKTESKSIPNMLKDSYFSTCPRDEEGRCKPSGAVAEETGAEGATAAPPSGETPAVEPGQELPAIGQALAKKGEGLPKKASNAVAPNIGYEGLKQEGATALKSFQELLDLGKGIGAKLGFKTVVPKSEQEFVEALSGEGGVVLIAPLKSQKRSEEKVNADYQGDWSKLTDMVRGSIAVDTVEELYNVVDKLTREYNVSLAGMPKDRMTQPLPTGYRDIMLHLKMPNGIAAELQLHLKPMILAKQLYGHKPYEEMRSIDAKMQVEGRTQMTPEEKIIYDKAFADSRSIYDTAWAQATKPKEAA